MNNEIWNEVERGESNETYKKHAPHVEFAFFRLVEKALSSGFLSAEFLEYERVAGRLRQDLWIGLTAHRTKQITPPPGCKAEPQGNEVIPACQERLGSLDPHLVPFGSAALTFGKLSGCHEHSEEPEELFQRALDCRAPFGFALDMLKRALAELKIDEVALGEQYQAAKVAANECFANFRCARVENKWTCAGSPSGRECSEFFNLTAGLVDNCSAQLAEHTKMSNTCCRLPAVMGSMADSMSAADRWTKAFQARPKK